MLVHVVVVVTAMLAAGEAIPNRLLFAISDAEKTYVKEIWKLYLRDLKAPDDILGVIISLFQEKPEIAGMIHEKFHIELKIERIRQLAHVITDMFTKFLNDILPDDNAALQYVTRYADLFHERDIPIESILLYPLGIMASKIAGRTQNPEAGEIFTKFSFGIATVLCGPPSPTGFNGITDREQALMVNAWAHYLNNPTLVELLVATTFASLPDLGRLSPELKGMQFNKDLNFRTSKNFRTFLNDKILKFTNFLRNLNDKKRSQVFVTYLADEVNKEKISLVTVFFGSIILLIKQMKENLQQNFDAETERAYLKLGYSSFPQVMQVQSFGQVFANGTVTK